MASFGSDFQGEDHSLPYVRIVGRPKIEKTEVGGLRTIHRNYVVDPQAAQAEDLEDKVFLPIGTSDIEYHDALLVGQQLNSTEDVDRVTLSRVYQELPKKEGEKILISSPDIERLEGQRQRVTLRYLVRLPWVQPLEEVKDKTLEDILNFPETVPPEPHITLGTSPLRSYNLGAEGSPAQWTFLGSQKIDVKSEVHAILTEVYHSHDKVVSEAQSMTKFGVATSTTVVNPTYIPAGATDISISESNEYFSVTYKKLPNEFLLMSEREAYRQDGARTLTRTYSAPKVEGVVFGGSLTPEDSIPSEILQDAPLYVLQDGMPDWTDTLPGFNPAFFETLYTSHYWILSNAAVDCSDPRRDVWTLTWITAGMPFWVRQSEAFNKPGVVTLSDTDITYDVPPTKVPLMTQTYGWFEMAPEVQMPAVDWEIPDVTISGSVKYADGDVQNFDREHVNMLRDGLDQVDFVALGAGAGVNRFKGRAVGSSGVIDIMGTKLEDYKIKGTVLRTKITPIFRKAANYIWRMEKTVIMEEVF